MDLSKIYNIVLHSNFYHDETLCNELFEKIKIKYPDAIHLRATDDNQIEVFENSLNSWRFKPKTEKPFFKWPFLGYRFRNRINEERDVFVEDFFEIEKFLNEN